MSLIIPDRSVFSISLRVLPVAFQNCLFYRPDSKKNLISTGRFNAFKEGFLTRGQYVLCAVMEVIREFWFDDTNTDPAFF